MPQRPVCVLSLAVSCALSLLLPSAAVARRPDDNGTVPPKDPKSLLLLAGQINGLYGDDLKPWHLKVSYKVVDGSGQTTDDGTIEELWISAHMRKLVITSRTSKLTEVETDKGIYREGDLNQKLALLMLLEGSYVRPMPYAEKVFPSLALTVETRTMGSSQLSCFTIKYRTPLQTAFNDPAYCLETKLPIMRISTFPDDPHQFIRTSIGKFQDRYVPISITAGEGKPDLFAHLELLGRIANVDPADFRPSANAVLLREAQSTLVIPDGVFDSMIRSSRGVLHPISLPEPKYPAEAQAANIHGEVKLRATISTDGHIESLHVIKGPPMLQQAALDAVWRWRFEAPSQNGRPALIVTIIPVRF